ncbi:uncharacterized protein [Hemitrygon akajei]|uniref:uncharacterized protein n=1 Tax=Hemitrygon akajei TaxID=2704970 RepID=UPI003BF9A781
MNLNSTPDKTIEFELHPTKYPKDGRFDRGCAVVRRRSPAERFPGSERIRQRRCQSRYLKPHEFARKSVTGTTLPVWLTSPGPVLLRKHARSNKYSPLVEKVHLLHANPQYAYVVLPDGREDTVSVRDLAPAGAADHYPEHSTVTMHPVPEVTPHAPCPTQTPYASVPGPSLTREGSLTPPVGTELTHSLPSEHTPPPAPVPSSPPAPVQLQPELRRSQRTIRPPDRLNL